MDEIKSFFKGLGPWLVLAGQLLLGLIIAFAVPGSIWAVLAAQLLHLAFVGVGGAKLSKPVMSGVVFVVALVVTGIQSGVSFLAFPAFSGDAALYAQAIFAWAEAALKTAAPLVGGAMLLYNIAIEKLLTVFSERSKTISLEPGS